MARILIIEDNPANMKLAVLLLHNAGHEALSAVDAETGMAMARADQPDLILMDIQLPGMDGLTATALLKQDAATAHIPIIALTAMAMKEDEEKSQKAGCDAYIAKPLRHGELYAAIDSLLAATVVTTGEVIPVPVAGHVMTEPAHTILIVDDEPQNRKLLETLLHPKAMSTLTANTGEEALASVRLQLPDLILLDVMMPGMDGYEVAKILKTDPYTSQYPDHHGDRANGPQRPARRAQCGSRGVPDQTGQPGRTVAAGPQPVAPQGAA